jgi:preprotein translocase subunit SecE
MKWLIGFIKESWAELKKVVWPTSDQVVVQSQRVLASVFLVSCFFGVVNYVLFLAIELLF